MLHLIRLNRHAPAVAAWSMPGLAQAIRDGAAVADAHVAACRASIAARAKRHGWDWADGPDEFRERRP